MLDVSVDGDAGTGSEGSVAYRRPQDARFVTTFAPADTGADAARGVVRPPADAGGKAAGFVDDTPADAGFLAADGVLKSSHQAAEVGIAVLAPDDEVVRARALTGGEPAGRLVVTDDEVAQPGERTDVIARPGTASDVHIDALDDQVRARQPVEDTGVEVEKGCERQHRDKLAFKGADACRQRREKGRAKKAHDQCRGGHLRGRWAYCGRTDWQRRSGRVSSQA